MGQKTIYKTTNEFNFYWLSTALMMASETLIYEYSKNTIRNHFIAISF